MNQELNNELLLVQQHSLPQKYTAWMEEFNDMSTQLNQSLTKPLSKMSKTVSRLVKNRGKMLMILDQRIEKISDRYKL